MSEVGEEVAELLGEHLDDAEGRAILEYAAEDDRARFELSLAFSRCVDDKDRLERELQQALRERDEARAALDRRKPPSDPALTKLHTRAQQNVSKRPWRIIMWLIDTLDRRQLDLQRTEDERERARDAAVALEQENARLSRVAEVIRPLLLAEERRAGRQMGRFDVSFPAATARELILLTGGDL